MSALRVAHDQALPAFLDQLDRFGEVVRPLDDRRLMAASRCTGWTAVDVIVHVHMALQEMLLGLVTSSTKEPTRDAATYWQATLPTTDDDADSIDNMRFVRLLGAAYRRPVGALRHFAPTLAGVRAAAHTLPRGAVAFQGHVLATGDFLTTWAVELAIHHLDLLIATPPVPAALSLTRRTVEALAGDAFPTAWPDDVVALLGAGRLTPTAAQRAESPAAACLPVLG